MPIERDDKEYQFAISLSVLNHLGRNLYRNFVTVIGEAISNSWDADASKVWIDIDRDENKFMISDDGVGMTPDDFQSKFLKIGYSKRKEVGPRSDSGRPFIGAKGIGKLALLSCADRISIFTHTKDTPYTGGVIVNEGLDKAITDDLLPDDYPLENLDYSLIDGLFKNDKQGTTIVFEGAERVLKNRDSYIRKIIALSFQFSLIDPNFQIILNGDPISVDDLSALSEKTQFLWRINEYDDKFLQSIKNLALPEVALESKLPLSGYIASVELPRHAKISGMDERVTVDLFVNGRVRDRNVIRHIPTQRVVESYIYGQIHFDSLDRDGSDPFTSSREGVVDSDPEFQRLLLYIQKVLLPKIFDDWDKFRREVGKEGDDENPSVSKKERKAAALVAATEEEYTEDLQPEQKGVVEKWISELRPDANFNVSSYVDCFLSENLVRKYMAHAQIALTDPSKARVEDFKKKEQKALEEANINFDLRRDPNDLNYLDMRELAINAEGGKTKDGKQTPLFKSSIDFKPARDAMSHTAVLTNTAKSHMTLTFENIRGRVVRLLNSLTP
jgi:DNA mismatch repair enzyme (predicted ATPase)